MGLSRRYRIRHVIRNSSRSDEMMCLFQRLYCRYRHRSITGGQLDTMREPFSPCTDTILIYFISVLQPLSGMQPADSRHPDISRGIFHRIALAPDPERKRLSPHRMILYMCNKFHSNSYFKFRNFIIVLIFADLCGLRNFFPPHKLCLCHLSPKGRLKRARLHCT